MSLRSGVAFLIWLVWSFAWSQNDPAQAPSNPAFLDSWNEVTFWAPESLTAIEAKERASVRVDGKDIPIIAAIPRAAAIPDVIPGQVVLPGTFQKALGGSEWNPNGHEALMTEVSAGVFELVRFLPAGTYEYKIARNGSWVENWGANFEAGGQNLRIEVPFGGKIVKFVVDFNQRTIKNSLTNLDVVAPNRVPELVPRQEGLSRSFTLRLSRPVGVHEISKSIVIFWNGRFRGAIIARDVLNEPEFLYDRDDLGSRWTKQYSTFKVWSPVSEWVDLVFAPQEEAKGRTIPMKRGSRGVWYVTVAGDLHNKKYQYHLSSYGVSRRAADINCFAATADSEWSVVVDLNKTNPANWPPKQTFLGKKATDAVIYEAHIRDLTIHPSSGVRPDWRGKYLGVAERGTRVPGSPFPTGLDYLQDLGITHLHLLPFQNFNPANSEVYNWGYETTLFNVPEEQFSTNRLEPMTTIRECKEMITAVHSAGIGVVMDVVYNHSVPSEGAGSAFWQTVPNYYFRTNDKGEVLNESGVGNALNDERPMVRKFIRDSLVFWTREYRVAGFRFDLIGMFTRESIVDWANAIRSVNPWAVIYGEPWTGGGPTRFGKGDQKGTGVAVFNDFYRSAVRGGTDDASPGFAMGNTSSAKDVILGLTGSIRLTDQMVGFADHPSETINYVSAHDNLTLRDKISRSVPEVSQPTIDKMVNLAHALVLLSEGIPFIEGGAEIGRTKGGNHNSYNAGDDVNSFRWDLAPQYEVTRASLKKLIALRQAHPELRLPTGDEVREQFQVMSRLPEGVVGFTVGNFGVAFNGNQRAISVEVSSGRTIEIGALEYKTWAK